MTNVCITSLQNPRVKQAVRLRDHRGRRQQGRFLIDGAREISRAVLAGIRVREVFCCDELIRDEELNQSIRSAQANGAERIEVSAPVFAKLAFGDRAEGAVAVADYPVPTWPEWRLPDDALVVVLENVEKPGNLGGILRTADAVGAAGLLLSDPSADLFNPNAIRASLGAVFTVPTAAAPASDVLAWLRRRTFRLIATRVDAAMPYFGADYLGRTAIILGSEASGLSSLWAASDIMAVSLPMRGTIDSLNVSVTAAVLLYEALRQRAS